MHDDPVIKIEIVQPSGIGSPQLGPAPTDEGVLPELVPVGGHAVFGGIFAAAVERPIVDTVSSADDSRGKIAIGATQCDVGLALAEVAKVLAIVQLDQDFGVTLVQLSQDRGEDADCEDFLGRDSDGAARVAGESGGSFGKTGSRAFYLLCASKKGISAHQLHRMSSLEPLQVQVHRLRRARHIRDDENLL